MVIATSRRERQIDEIPDRNCAIAVVFVVFFNDVECFVQGDAISECAQRFPRIAEHIPIPWNLSRSTRIVSSVRRAGGCGCPSGSPFRNCDFRTAKLKQKTLPVLMYGWPQWTPFELFLPERT